MKKVSSALMVAALGLCVCAVSAVSVHATVYYYDANGATAGVGGTPAPGSWASGAGGAMWTTDPAGVSPAPSAVSWSVANGNEAVFSGTPATIGVNSGGVNPSSLKFTVSGYTINVAASPGQLQLVTKVGGALPPGTIEVTTSGHTATISALLAGTIGYKKTGAGTLRLTNGANTITGPVSISGGTLRMSDYTVIGGTSAGAGDITITNNSVLRNDDTTVGGTFMTVNRNIILGTGGGTLNVNDADAILAYNGVISGSGQTLTKSGAGEFRALQGWTFGNLNVTGGLYRINGTGGGETGFGTATNTITISNAAAVGTSVGITSPSTRTFSLNSGTTGATFVINAGWVINGLITGAGKLSVNGNNFSGSASSTLTLTNANNDYAGSTTINTGILSVNQLANGGANSTIGKSSNAASNLVLNGTAGAATLKYTGAGHSTDRLFSLGTGATAGTIDASGTGAVDFTNAGSMGLIGSGTRTLTLTGTNTGDNTIAAAIGGTGTDATTVAKTGTGTWVLSNANTYTGGTTISGGTLKLGNASALGTGTFTFSAGGTFDNVTGGAITVSNPLALSGGSPTFTGSNDMTFNNSATVALSGSVGNNRTVTVTNGGATLTHDGVISDGGNNMGITKAGNGTLILGGANTATASFRVNAGILSVSNIGNTAGNSNLGTNGTFNFGGGTLKYTGPGETSDKSLNFVSSGANGTIDQSGASGLVKITGGVSATGGGAHILTLQGSTVGTGEISGVIANGSGTGTAVTKAGTGTWTLSGSNTYTGITTINGGELNTTALANGGANSSIGASTNVAGNLVINGGTLKYSGGTTSSDRGFTVGLNGATIDASGTGPVTFANTGSFATSGTGTHLLTLTGTNTGDNTMSKVIVDAGADATSLTKNGAGKWILTEASSYSGVTAVNGGTLLANNNSGSATGSSTVNVAGGKLGGNGTISGPVNVMGGTLAAGGSIGTLNIGATLTLTSGTFENEFKTTLAYAGDLVNVDGDLNITAGVVLSLVESGLGLLPAGTKYTLISYDDVWNSGVFTYLGNPLNDGDFFTLNANTYRIDYDDPDVEFGVNSGLGSGAFDMGVTITAVPELSSALGFGLSGVFAAAAVWYGRRRGIVLSL
jgi:fibronectin-binding autotransporter adhesin